MSNLPYLTSPGNIDKALNGIISAAVPEKVSQDFVKTILKIPGGSGNQITPFLKKLGWVSPDGSPNNEYKKFRNPSSSGAAVAKAIRLAYRPLFVRNEYANKLSDEDLAGLIVEETGQPHDSNPVKLSLNTLRHLKKFARFDQAETVDAIQSVAAAEETPNSNVSIQEDAPATGKIGLNLGYTINLNLPPSSDPAVFDAIFKSLKANLLSDQDG